MPIGDDADTQLTVTLITEKVASGLAAATRA
jgi:hypothetical protein